MSGLIVAMLQLLRVTCAMQKSPHFEELPTESSNDTEMNIPSSCQISKFQSVGSLTCCSHLCGLDDSCFLCCITKRMEFASYTTLHCFMFRRETYGMRDIIKVVNQKRKQVSFTLL